MSVVSSTASQRLDTQAATDQPALLCRLCAAWPTMVAVARLIELCVCLCFYLGLGFMVFEGAGEQ